MKHRRIAGFMALLLSLAMALTACAPPAGYLAATDPKPETAATEAAATAAPEGTTAPATDDGTETTGPADEPEAPLAPSDRAPDWVTQLLWDAMGVERDAEGHALVDFADMTYEKPDLAALDGRMAELVKMAGTADDAEGLFDLYDQVLADYGMASTQLTLVNILSDLDVNDEALSADKLELEGKINEYYEQLGRITTTILDSPLRDEAVGRWGQTYVDNSIREAALTNEAVQPIIKEVNALTEEYQQVLVNHTVDVKGKALTLDELSQRSDLGMAYYTYLNEYYVSLNRKAGEIFLKLVKLRNQLAQELGYDDYVTYSYVSYNRDYTPEDAAAMAAAVKKYLVPLHSKLGFETPDLVYEGDRVTSTVEEAITTLQRIMPKISEDMGKAAAFMLEHHLYDFSGSASKMDGGYTTDIAGYGVPFINWKSSAGYNSVSTVVHEFGHFYNTFSFPHSAWNETNILDLAEIHSQGLELILQLYYDEIYGEDKAEAVRASELQSTIYTVISGCMEDEFQQRLYREENLTLERLNGIYEELLDEYHLYDGYYIPNSFWANTWVSIHHTFQVPLYYISYATSLAAALEIWKTAENDPQAAVEQYLKVQSYSAYEPFQATLAACGLSSPFEEDTIRSLALQLETYFNALWAQEAGEDTQH